MARFETKGQIFGLFASAALAAILIILLLNAEVKRREAKLMKVESTESEIEDGLLRSWVKGLKSYIKNLVSEEDEVDESILSRKKREVFVEDTVYNAGAHINHLDGKKKHHTHYSKQALVRGEHELIELMRSYQSDGDSFSNETHQNHGDNITQPYDQNHQDHVVLGSAPDHYEFVHGDDGTKHDEHHGQADLGNEISYLRQDSVENPSQNWTSSSNLTHQVGGHDHQDMNRGHNSSHGGHHHGQSQGHRGHHHGHNHNHRGHHGYHHDRNRSHHGHGHQGQRVHHIKDKIREAGGRRNEVVKAVLSLYCKPEVYVSANFVNCSREAKNNDNRTDMAHLEEPKAEPRRQKESVPKGDQMGEDKAHARDDSYRLHCECDFTSHSVVVVVLTSVVNICLALLIVFCCRLSSINSQSNHQQLWPPVDDFEDFDDSCYENHRDICRAEVHRF